MSFYGWKPYVSVAERRRKAEKQIASAKKTGKNLSPVAASKGAIAKSFWGKAWCDNLERYSDYANRLPRGRTYVRNGSVIDLKITEGEVRAQVMGSSLYKVTVSVTAVPPKQWQSISADCAGSIDSLVELLQGRLSKAVMARICTQNTGLFPVPKEVQFSCSCPDWASMCKHVAAVLYGVGARLDEQPELIFTLRRVDAKDLITQASAGRPKSRQRPAANKVLDDALVADVFGIEMATAAPATRAVPPRAASSPTKVAKTAMTPKSSADAKTETTKKAVSDQKPKKSKEATKSSVGSRKATTIKTKATDRTILPTRKVAATRRASGRVAKEKSH